MLDHLLQRWPRLNYAVTTAWAMLLTGAATGNASAACTSTFSTDKNISALTGLLGSISNLFANTWVKIIFVIALVIVIALLLFDGGNLPQIVKNILQFAVGLMLLFAIIAWINGQSAASATC